MEIICLQENLKKGLNITERIIGKNLTLPILNNILISVEKSSIKLCSTDLEIGINCEISGKIIKQGAIVIPAKVLTSFINNLPNKKVQLKTKDNKLTIKCENYKSQIKGFSPEEFPIIPKIKSEPILKINKDILRTGLSQIVEITAISESRPEISGIYMKFEKESIKTAATDSFRLAEKIINDVDIASINENEIIIPKRTIVELIRILQDDDIGNIELVLNQNQVLFNLSNVQIISRLIEGKFPDYTQITPKEFQTQVITNKQELINNIKLASFFSGKANEVKLSILPSKSLVELSSEDADIGSHKSSLPAKIQGKSIKISFNYRYLLDGLNNIFSDKVIISVGKEAGKTLITSVGDESYKYIVMPIKA